MNNILKLLIIQIALFLSKSKPYLEFKQQVRRLLTDDNWIYKKIFDYVMIVLVITSIFLLVYNSATLSKDFVFLEELILIVFVTEYFARVWIYGDVHKIVLEHYYKSKFLKKPLPLFAIVRDIAKLKFEYMRTPLAIIDLLAILPDLRALRFLRIFLVFRLFKLFRYTKSINKFLTVIDDKKFELFALFMLFGFVILISSIAMYIFEIRLNDNINSLFDAIYWSYVTIASLGYGDISPVSSEGRVVTLFLILSGIAFVSFATSIITSAFSDKIIELREEKLRDKINKLKNTTLIFGYNSIAISLYRQLKSNGERPVIICETEKENEEAISRKILAIRGEIGDSKFLESIGIRKNVIRVVSLFDNEIKNLNTVLTARSLNRDITIFSLIEQNTNRKKFYLAGVTKVIYPNHIFSKMVTTYIKYPKVFKAIEHIIFRESDIVVEEIKVLPNSFLENRRVDEVEFGKFQMVLFGVLRDGKFHFNPPKEFQFLKDDILIMFGRKEKIGYLR